MCFPLIERRRHRLGLFQALDEARESPHAPKIGELYGWFKQNLAVPKTFGDWATGLSWFKSPAQTHIANIHRLKAALEACGVHVEVLTTRAPGVVVFEDEHQIVAIAKGRRS